MAFTNTWDTNFPPDTQLANLLGQDIRNGVKVDVQQRMAAISGLDAAKPTFGSDAQPANWNGILFFATDTGKIYQFNNPAWTDVTTSLKAPSSVIYKNTTQITHTGDTNVDTIFTTGLPILTAQSILRITFLFSVNSQGGPSSVFTTNINGTFFTLVGINSNLAVMLQCTHYIYNINSVSLQGSDATNVFRGADGAAGAVAISTGGPGAVNTGVPTTLTLTATNGQNSDSQTFRHILVELL